MQVTPADQARRGSGRTMATILAAQLWARDNQVALFLPGPIPPGGQIHLWLQTLLPEVALNISVFGVKTLEEVRERLRGRGFSKVFVDHSIIERSEQDLATAIKHLELSHSNQLANLEVIR